MATQADIDETVAQVEALDRRIIAVDGDVRSQEQLDAVVGGQGGVASQAPPKYELRSASTAFTPFEQAVKQLLAKTPDMPATVIAERVGWTGSITWFRDNVRRLRPEHRPVDPSDRLTWLPGDVAQCDLWFPPKKTPCGGLDRAPVLGLAAVAAKYAQQLLGGDAVV
jgi:hypothetical protein